MPAEGETGPCSPAWEHLQAELEEDLQAGKASVPHGTTANLGGQKQHCFYFPPNNSGNYVNEK